MPIPLGVQFTLLMGQTVPVPIPASMSNALDSAEITHSDGERSGFQLTFKLGRADASDLRDYDLVSAALIKPFSRVILVVTVNARPQVVMDGAITHHQFMPSNQPGESKLIITGEDISVMMDLEEKVVAYPALPEAAIATKIIASYARYGLTPKVIPPTGDLPPLPTERIPVQHGTDLEHLQELAKRHGYVFYVAPGPIPGANVAYWGPPNRLGVPQPALSLDMGSSTNIESLRFEYDSLAASTVNGQVQDRKTNRSNPVETKRSTRLPALAKRSALKIQGRHVRQVLPTPIAGLTRGQAKAFAQGTINRSLDQVVTGEGELSVVRYGQLLKAGQTVGVRGCGNSYDGLYLVKKVTHLIQSGDYRQQFTLAREGLGALMPVVRP